MAAVVFSADVDDSGLGLDGTVHNNAWKQAMATAINAAMGDWTASAGSWTVASGDVVKNRYQIINKTMTWQFEVTTTTVSTTPVSLRVAIPTGTLASTNQAFRCAYVLDNGTQREVLAQPGDTTHIYFTRVDAGNWTAATDATTIFVTAVWEMA